MKMEDEELMCVKRGESEAHNRSFRKLIPETRWYRKQRACDFQRRAGWCICARFCLDNNTWRNQGV